MATKRNQTSHAEFFALCTKVQTLDTSACANITAVAGLLQATGDTRNYSESSIAKAMATVGKTLGKSSRGRLAGKPSAGKTPSDKVGVVARHLVALYKSLGQGVPKQLDDIAKHRKFDSAA